jgi:hypothetical protein
MAIFVQIASYRDPQLVPTIKDMVAQAYKPEELKICIHNQYSETDEFSKDIDEFRNDSRFIIIDTPCLESKGACGARHAIQQHYGGEDYTLQLDSHHRFVKDWDKECIEMIKELQEDGYKKPLLTGYIPSFDPENDPQARVQEPWRMVFDRFIPEGAIFFLPETIPQWQELLKPVPARFYSAHFCFTLGSFAEEVQHDPEFYFHGEEISVGVRAYTHGYDLFHPHKVIAWHEYTRKGRTKQWDDDPKWGDKNNFAHLKNRRLFSMDGQKYSASEFGKYGFGAERTLKDYEKYAGILFSKRSIQKSVINKIDPPVTESYQTEEEWLASFSKIFKHCIDLGYEQLPEKDYEYIVVAFHNDKDETIHRVDILPQELHGMFNDPDGYIKIWREFQTVDDPKYWVVWPFSTSKGWCERITGNL